MRTANRPLRHLRNALLATLAAAALAGCGGGGGDATPSGGGGGGGGGIQPGTWKAANVIGSGTAVRAVATDASGNAVAVWMQGSRVWANTYLAGGGWGNPTPVDGGSASVGDATVAMGGGTALAVWQEGTLGTRRFASGAWGGMEQVPDSGNSGMVPLAGMDGAGNAFVAWWRASDYRLFVCRRGAGGWEQAPTEVTADPAADTPSLAVSAGGAALIVWTSGGGRVNTLAYAPATGWEATFTSVDDNGGAPGGPRAALDESGNAFVVWNEGGVLKGSHRPAGGAWQGEETVYDGGGLGNYLVAAGHGAAMAAWNENGRVGAAAFYPGTGWALTAYADDGATPVTGLRLGMDGGGNAIALWMAGDAILASRHAAATGWGAATRMDDGTGIILNPALAVSSGGTAMAAWKQGGGADQIAAARYAP